MLDDANRLESRGKDVLVRRRIVFGGDASNVVQVAEVSKSAKRVALN